MSALTLSPREEALLREVRVSDEDHGGLSGMELTADDFQPMTKLCDLGLVEAQGEYGEAPDGEEDERAMGATSLVYRITGRGVSVLQDLGFGQ